jgi:hypothetical protein
VPPCCRQFVTLGCSRYAPIGHRGDPAIGDMETNRFAICELGSTIGKQNDVQRPVRKLFFIGLKLLLCMATVSNRLANGPNLLLCLAIMCNVLHIWRPMGIGGPARSLLLHVPRDGPD